MKNKNEMLLSIIVPVYNTEKYLRECLDSIVPQAKELYPLCEIILVDDGSIDKSGRICDEYEEWYGNFIKVFHKKNEGSFCARKFGLDYAQGEYILYCDSDDFWEKNTLISIKKAIEDGNYPDVLIFNFSTFENGKKKVKFENLFNSGRINKKDVLKEYMNGYALVSMCIKVCKRSCLSTGVDSDYIMLKHGDDSLQTLDVLDHAESFYYINRALYNYRIDSGMTSKYDSKYYVQFKGVLLEILKRKEMWELDEFDILFLKKLFCIIGRSITQSRLNIWRSNVEHIEYIEKIRYDDLVEKYLDKYAIIKEELQFNYKIILPLFINKKFRILCKILCLYNLRDKINIAERINSKHE